jgi:hypothetical protein
MNASIKIESPRGLEHFQKLNMEGATYGAVLGLLADTPVGTEVKVTVTKDDRPIVFECSMALDTQELLRIANAKRRVRKTATTPEA